MSNDLGQAIRMHRLAKQMTQLELAEQVGCSTAYISRIESGHRPATAELLGGIAEALDINLAELIEARNELSLITGAQLMHRELVRQAQALARANEQFAEWMALLDPECAEALIAIAARLRQAVG